MFSEKLDFLMKITDTTNSHLAHIANLDSSYISRLRRGTRTPAKNENYIKVFTEYFAKYIALDYQKAAFCEKANIKVSALPQTLDDMSLLIRCWLIEKELPKTSSVETFVKGMSIFPSKSSSTFMDVNVVEITKGLSIHSEVYFGLKGKQDAVINFLSLVLLQKKPSTLLLYSEEDPLWLIENPEFMAKWGMLMSQIIARGNKIKIIHTVSRSLDEMLSSISQWLPLYMSGAIEPYYYPKYRDGVFKQTRFLAPYTAAVVSNTVGGGSENTANYLFTDREILFSLVDEFNAYLSLCRPLIHIYTKPNIEKYLSALSEFEGEEGSSILKAATLSNITMPLKVISTILSRNNGHNMKKIQSGQRKRIGIFEKNLGSNNFTEIISLPEISDILAKNIPINFSDMVSDTRYFYTPQEYILHLQNIIRLLETYENYHVYLESKKQIDNIMVYTKEEVGVIIAKYELPSVLFAINESNMTSAFWVYMKDKIKTLSKDKQNKQKVIAELKSVINALENY